MKKYQLLIVAPLLLQAPLVFADLKLGNWDLAAKVGLGAQMTNGAQKQSAKFAEYEDVRNSVLGYANIQAEQGAYHLGFDASRIGLKDQAYVLDGGSYGTFKYELFYKSLFHKYSVNATTMYDPASVGTANLTIPAGVSGSAPYTWPAAHFDYTLTKKTYGVDASYDTGAPLTFGLGFNQVKDSGLKPLGVTGRKWTTTGVEIPEPIDYKTNNFTANVGYTLGDWHTNLNGMLSKFTNNNPKVYYSSYIQEPGLSALSTYGAPKNDYYKLGWQNIITKLPLDSSIIAKASYAKLSNTLPADQSVDGPVNGTIPTPTTFEGDLRYGTANLAWSANPIHGLDTKLFYNYLRKWNKSTEVSYPGSTASAAPTKNGLFGYYKHNAGMDAGYKLPFRTKIGAGYEHLNIHRLREDGAKTRDNIVFAEVKNSYFDMVQGKVKYSRLSRTSEFNKTFTGATAFYRSVDVTDKKGDKLAVGFDVAPVEHLDMSVEYSYKKNTYNPGTLRYGRQKDTINSVMADVSYELPKIARISAFGGYDKGLIDTLRSSDMNKDPALASNTTNGFKIALAENNKAWEYGLGVTVPVIEKKWDVSLGWEQYKNDGDFHFDGGNSTLAPGAGSTAPRIDITNYNDSLRTVIKANTKYQFTDNLSLTANYLYERQTYTDFAWDGYQLVYIPGIVLTGAYADNVYKAHTGYLVAEYRF